MAALTAPKPTIPLQARIRPVLQRFARISRSGKPVICGAAGTPRGNHKIVYDTVEQAVAAELELRRITGVQEYPYPCARSTHGHVHLARTPPAERQEPTP